MRLVALCCVAVAVPALALGQGRPSEDEIFGGSSPDRKAEPAERTERKVELGPQRVSSKRLGINLRKLRRAKTAARTGRTSPPEPETTSEQRLFGKPTWTDDPLKIGGVLYLRMAASATEDTPPFRWPFSAPALMDLYLDARPSDRVRGFVLARTRYDPTDSAVSLNFSSPDFGTVTVPSTSNPKLLVDQLWLRFDIERAIFITVGRQHAKWGVGRFWNPTDYLHATSRDPLSLFDDRTGTTMLRVNIPWERYGWNLYGVAIFEPLMHRTEQTTGTLIPASEATGNVQVTTSSTGGNMLATVGGGARAEIVVGSWELGLDGVVQRGSRPRFGIDLSGGIWDFDLHGEVSLRTSSDVPVLLRDATGAPVTYEPTGVRPQVAAGGDLTIKYSDQDSVILGGEYYYNSNGVEDIGLYPSMIAAGGFVPFRVGRHYAAAYLALPAPGSWNLHTFTLTGIANISDQTAVARLDWTVMILNYIQFELYLAGRFGPSGGEFRFSLPKYGVLAPNAEGGIALRLNL